MKKYNVFLVYFLSFLYLEILLKVLIGSTFSINIIIMLLFNTAFSILLTILTHLFGTKVNKTFFYIYMSLFLIWFGASFVLKKFFGFYLTLSTFNLADQIANGFTGDAVNVVLQNILPILLIALPLILSIIFGKKFNFERYKLKRILICLGLLILFSIGYVLSLNIKKDNDYSAYELFYKRNDIETNVEKIGVINSLSLDIYRSIFGFEETYEVKEKEEPKEPEVIVYTPNTLDIDFDTMINNTNKQALKNISNYLMNEEPTYKNPYTGYFKDKNLILFMAESFNSIAVSEELTPTLYKLANNGFVFENFYTPTIYSTIGGEFQELTGLYAATLDTLSAFRKKQYAFPFGIANMFKQEGYKTYAFHDSYSTFQDRNKYIPSLGFETFEGCESKNNSISCKPWPSSDEAMITATIDRYSKMPEIVEEIIETKETKIDTNTKTDTKTKTKTKEKTSETKKEDTTKTETKKKVNQDKFLTYYITVSGHGDYVASSAYYKKYKSQIKEKYPNISTNSAAYVAGQMELDRALETLLKLLEERGILEDTVIALVGDHSPYYLYEKSMNYINEISTYTRDSKIELFRSNFILYNSGMKENVNVTKIGSQIDVMPTLYNLFGLNYDSRMFIGNDILSDTPGLAIMADKSWVSDEGYYVSSKSKFTQTSENELDENYVSNINSIVKNRTSMSKNIIVNNYYNTIVYKQEEVKLPEQKTDTTQNTQVNQKTNKETLNKTN